MCLRKNKILERNIPWPYRLVLESRIIAYLPVLWNSFTFSHSLAAMYECHVRNPYEIKKFFSKFPPCLYKTRVFPLLFLVCCWRFPYPYSLSWKHDAPFLCVCLLYLSNYTKNLEAFFPCLAKFHFPALEFHQLGFYLLLYSYLFFISESFLSRSNFNFLICFSSFGIFLSINLDLL